MPCGEFNGGACLLSHRIPCHSRRLKNSGGGGGGGCSPLSDDFVFVVLYIYVLGA